MRVVVQREGGYGEWTLIELQGEVATHSEASLEGLELGTFTILDKKGENATLVVGNHCLDGKRVKLKKPFAVLRKSSSDEGEDQTKWGIAALIRYKYLFKNRPKPA